MIHNPVKYNAIITILIYNIYISTETKFPIATILYSRMRVVIVPLNSDNYGYLLINEETREAAFVDISGQADMVLGKIMETDVKVTHVLTTHKHWDHAGGNLRFKEIYDGDVQILGSATDNVEVCFFMIMKSKITVTDTSIHP